jgi:hypothetical protein
MERVPRSLGFFGTLAECGAAESRSPVYSSSFNAAKPCSPPKSELASVLPSRIIAFLSQNRALR